MYTEITPTFAPPVPAPPAPVVRKSHRRLVAGTIVGALVLIGGIANAAKPDADPTFTATRTATSSAPWFGTEGLPTADTTPAPLSDADIQVMALEIIWPTTGPPLCDAMNEALAVGLDYDFVINFGMESFASSYGEPMTAALTAALRAHLEDC